MVASRLLKTYYQLTKPGILYGNAMTAVAGFLLASRWHIAARLFVALIAGLVLVIASACVFNNYIDRGIDKKMARTKKRAIATGMVSGRSALLYAGCLGTAGFAVLLYTNLPVVAIGLGAYISYIVLYGLAKRRSVHGTLVGTVPGAASLVAGYVAVTDRFDAGALLLFLIMVTWQMPHFYAIAMRRRDDYAAAGIPVWPSVKGMRSTKIWMLFYVGAFIVAISALTFLGYTGYVFLAVMDALGLYWLWRGIQGFKTANDVKWGGQMFGLSLLVLLSLSVMLSVGSILP